MEFDARFSALRRRYRYLISDDPRGVDPLLRRHVAWHQLPEGQMLDASAMNAAVQDLLGLHDFGAFCRRRVGATTIRTLLKYTWTRLPDTESVVSGLVQADVEADAFCHSMVRALVGAALAVGDGRHDRTWLRAVLATGARDSRVNVAPPHGLVLEEVMYPSADQYAARAERSRARRDVPAGEL
jgi:tRNA pseudouridine38-40 synthase